MRWNKKFGVSWFVLRSLVSAGLSYRVWCQLACPTNKVSAGLSYRVWCQLACPTNKVSAGLSYRVWCRLAWLVLQTRCQAGIKWMMTVWLPCFGSPFKNCGLWTLSCDFCPSMLNETSKRPSSRPIMTTIILNVFIKRNILSVETILGIRYRNHSGGDSEALGMVPLSHPPSPTLRVSVSGKTFCRHSTNLWLVGWLVG